MPVWLSSSKGLRPYLRKQQTQPAATAATLHCQQRMCQHGETPPVLAAVWTSQGTYKTSVHEAWTASMTKVHEEMCIHVQAQPLISHDNSIGQQVPTLRQSPAPAHLSMTAAAAMVNRRFTPPVMIEAAIGDLRPAVANTCSAHNIRVWLYAGGPGKYELLLAQSFTSFLSYPCGVRSH